MAGRASATIGWKTIDIAFASTISSIARSWIAE